MRVLGLTKHSPNMIDRMNSDMAFDNSEAVTLLGVKPRPFYPVFRQAL